MYTLISTWKPQHDPSICSHICICQFLIIKDQLGTWIVINEFAMATIETESVPKCINKWNLFGISWFTKWTCECIHLSLQSSMEMYIIRKATYPLSSWTVSECSSVKQQRIPCDIRILFHIEISFDVNTSGGVSGAHYCEHESVRFAVSFILFWKYIVFVFTKSCSCNGFSLSVLL